MLGVIYKVTNKINKKSYIGQTINFERRKKDHLKAKDNYPFHNAIRKYGKENFSWEILEKCKKEELNEREIYWIKYYNTYYNGYNSTKGGNNADSLVKWIKTHPKESRKNALLALKKAQQYNIEHKEERLEQLASVRQKGIDKVKRKVKCVEKGLVFESLAEAERWSISDQNDNHKKASHQHISKVCSGKRHTCGGYHWEYVE